MESKDFFFDILIKCINFFSDIGQRSIYVAKQGEGLILLISISLHHWKQSNNFIWF